MPLKAVVGFLLSVAASLRSTLFIFQEWHLRSLTNVETPTPIVTFLPVLMFGILFGLAVGCEVVRALRIHEDYRHHYEAAAIRRGMCNNAVSSLPPPS